MLLVEKYSAYSTNKNFSESVYITTRYTNVQKATTTDFHTLKK